MSETKHQKGKLVPIIRKKEETVKSQIKSVLGDDFIEALWDWDEDDSDTQNVNDQIHYNNLENEYQFINSTLYKVINFENLDPDDSITKVYKNEDGSINFEFRYYNGGTCLSELLEENIPLNNQNT
jgi:hypothetical protein